MRSRRRSTWRESRWNSRAYVSSRSPAMNSRRSWCPCRTAPAGSGVRPKPRGYSASYPSPIRYSFPIFPEHRRTPSVLILPFIFAGCPGVRRKGTGNPVPHVTPVDRLHGDVAQERGRRKEAVEIHRPHRDGGRRRDFYDHLPRGGSVRSRHLYPRTRGCDDQRNRWEAPADTLL